KGTDVLGPDNAHIGNVSDMLFDKNGKILGLVVGVGGFLGIGEKSVAIDMSAFQPVPADTGSSTGAGGNTAMVSRNDDPTMVKLKVSWTKDQLKNAPDFQYHKPSARTTSGAGGSPTTGMAPRPTTPPAGRQKRGSGKIIPVAWCRGRWGGRVLLGKWGGGRDVGEGEWGREGGRTGCPRWEGRA